MTDTPQNYAEKFISEKVVPNETQRPLWGHYSGAWFAYQTGAGWREVKDEQVRAEVVRFLWRVLGEEKLTERLTGDVLACIKAALTLPEHGDGVPEMFLTFRNGDMTATPADGWIATQSHMIHVPGAAVAIHAGKLALEMVRPADAGLFARGMVPCDYDPVATCPRWERFVVESCPDDGGMLQMMFGLSLTQDRRYNVFFVIHGEAGTGKSTALDVLAALNAGTVCGVPLSDFGEKFQTYPLTENRLSLVQDMESVFEGVGSVSRREGVLKSCTAGESIQVEQKHQKPEHRKFTALLVFGANALPRFADRSGAISDRLRIISFPRVFRGTDRQDLRLADTLRAELPGILNWALRGYEMLLATGARTFPETVESSAIKAELIKSARPEELFCDEMLERDPGAVVSGDEVYKAYDKFCYDNGYKPVGNSRVIPEICRYMDAGKSTRTLDGARKRCLVGVRFVGERIPEYAGGGTGDDF